MTNWVGTGARSYDSTGRLLLHVGGLLCGTWFGLTIAHYYPSESTHMGTLCCCWELPCSGLRVFEPRRQAKTTFKFRPSSSIVVKRGSKPLKLSGFGRGGGDRTHDYSTKPH